MYKRLKSRLKDFAREVKYNNPTAQRLHSFWQNLHSPPPSSVKELQYVNPRRSTLTKPRINLLIPRINREQAYGGISTALNFFEAISQDYEYVRLIPYIQPSAKALKEYKAYQTVSLGKNSLAKRQIVPLSDSDKNTLSVGPEDIFVATYWTTAFLAQRLAKWQSREYNQPIKPIVYLIQDYEPAFYPWSSEYLAAVSTYQYEDPMIAVFNSSYLRDYFYRQNYSFEYEYTFEPRMNRVLRSLISPHSPKKKQILVYGRPSVSRNAFGLLIQSLKIWNQQCSNSSAWSVVSAGESHPDISLGNGAAVKSLGKLTLEQYAQVLNESAIGLSLMVSPHPSYPPLEMAHYGICVVTNSFENKDLSQSHDNITSVDIFAPEKIAERLVWLCQEIENKPELGWLGKSRMPNYLADQPEFPFAQEISAILMNS